MVLQLVYKAATFVFRPGYYIHTVVAIATLVVAYAFSQGRTTNRERDLHARTVLITGGFTPLGLTLISTLASRGARVIALSPYPLTHAQPTLLIPALRATTKNENIFAEYADLSSPASIRDFCTRLLTGDDQRLDAVIYAHEYRGIGSLFASTAAQEEKRVSNTLASFLMTTLLLPALLVAPVERDIRIIHLVNPFYAAGIPSFTSSLVGELSNASKGSRSVFVAEGNRALRTIVLARHLQRVLDALPNRAPTLDQSGPPGSGGPPTTDAPKGPNPHPSNIVSVSVCPGLSRTETVRILLGGEKVHDPDGYSLFGSILYFLDFPLIWFFAKGTVMATQTVLHALFLPTPFKRALANAYASVDPSGAAAPQKPSDQDPKQDSPARVEDLFTEVLKPGALYRECSVVTMNLPSLPPPGDDSNKSSDGPTATKSGGKKSKKDSKNVEEDLVIEDDGEFGGESLGRVIWEWYEQRLKAWENTEKQKQEATGAEEKGSK